LGYGRLKNFGAYICRCDNSSFKEEAENIVQGPLDERLIACGNIISPVSSIFCWAGNTERAEECMILAKSRLDLFEELSDKVKALHSYKIPEIIALPLIKGSDGYMK
jgi:periplasmic divalent cation tolerance protein